MEPNEAPAYVLMYTAPQKPTHCRYAQIDFPNGFGFPVPIQRATLFDSKEQADKFIRACDGPVRVCSVKFIVEDLGVV